MAWQDFPMIECPHCGKVSHVDDYHDITSGDYFYCEKCDKKIYVWLTDITMSADIQKEPL